MKVYYEDEASRSNPNLEPRALSNVGLIIRTADRLSWRCFHTESAGSMMTEIPLGDLLAVVLTQEEKEELEKDKN